MSNKVQEILDLFEQFGFSIEIQKNDDEHCNFKIPNCFIFYVKNDNVITISFDVSSKPDYSAFVVSLISNNLHFNNIFISDVYYSKDDDIYFGRNAHNEYINDTTKEIIESYEKQVKEYEMLQQMKPEIVH